MSRPRLFDETCDTCTQVINEAPYYEGTTVDGVTYCDKCLKKYKPREYVKIRHGKTAEDDKKRAEVQRKEIAKKEEEDERLIAQIIKENMEEKYPRTEYWEYYDLTDEI